MKVVEDSRTVLWPEASREPVRATDEFGNELVVGTGVDFRDGLLFVKARSDLGFLLEYGE